jgi:hypothetical protein
MSRSLDRSRDPSSLRPQPRRNGHDFWATPSCLTTALFEHVLPGLPQASIWECAAGDGRLAQAMRAAGYTVLASDIEPRGDAIARIDFLHDEPPRSGLLAATNPPFNLLSTFITRGLGLLDCGRIAGLVLLVRCDALTAASRAAAFDRANSIVTCCWRPVWAKDTCGTGRWANAWVCWLPDDAGPPKARWVLPQQRQRLLFSGVRQSFAGRRRAMSGNGTMALVDFALTLAARRLAVFPCAANKKPAIPESNGGRGCLDAVTDPEQVRVLFARAPNAKLVGVACGPASGVDILDTDPRNGGGEWERQNRHRLPETLIHGTPGGCHFVFCHHPGVRNRQGVPAPGIDIRGEGGYAIWPPSDGYRVIHDAEPAEWPQWLLEQVVRTEPPPRPIIPSDPAKISDARLDGLLRSLLQRLTNAPEGQKHETLLRIARTIGGYAHLFDLSDDQFVRLMLCALPTTVVDWKGAEKTARDGLRHGRESPLALEDRRPPGKGDGGVDGRAPGNDKQPESERPDETTIDVLAEIKILGPNLTLRTIVDIFNQKYAVANEGGKAVVMWAVHDALLQRDRHERATFADFVRFYQNYTFSIVVTNNGRQKTVTKSYAKWWLDNPRRRQYLGGVVFDPANRTSVDTLNLWRSWTVMPDPGDWSLMHEHIEQIICGGRPEIFNYVVRWLGHMVQKPHLAAETAIVLRGLKGTGKGMVGKWLLRLCGQHGLHIVNASHLTGRFSGHLRDAIFVFADEAFFAGDKQHEGVLKAMITEGSLLIEAKYRTPVMTPNMLHLLMASNATWVIPASHDERRYLMLDVTADKQGDATYFRKLDCQMEHGGLAAMLHDLLLLDLGDFHPRAVPATAELAEQKIHSLDSLHRWWLSVLDRGFLWRSRYGHQVFLRWDEFTSTELLNQSYRQWCADNRISRPEHRAALGTFLSKFYRPHRPRGRYPVYEAESVDHEHPEPVVMQKNPRGYAVGDLDAARQKFADILKFPADALPWDYDEELDQSRWET